MYLIAQVAGQMKSESSHKGEVETHPHKQCLTHPSHARHLWDFPPPS